SEGYGALEPEVEAATREIIRRGTVQLNLRVERSAAVDDYRINTDVLENYRRQLEAYSNNSGSKTQVDLQALLALPGVIAERARDDEDPREDWPMIEPVVQEALAATA